MLASMIKVVIGLIFVDGNINYIIYYGFSMEVPQNTEKHTSSEAIEYLKRAPHVFWILVSERLRIAHSIYGIGDTA